MIDIQIGDKVRYMKSIEWGPSEGDQGEVVHVFSDGRSFHVRLDQGGVWFAHIFDIGLIRQQPV